MVGTPSPKPMELLGAGSCSWQNAYDELSYWVVLTIFLSFHNLLSSEWECLNSHLNCRAYHRLFIKNSCSLSWSWSLSGLYTLSLLHLHILLERVWFEGTLPIECWLYIGLYLLSPVCLARQIPLWFDFKTFFSYAWAWIPPPSNHVTEPITWEEYLRILAAFSKLSPEFKCPQGRQHKPMKMSGHKVKRSHKQSDKWPLTVVPWRSLGGDEETREDWGR